MSTQLDLFSTEPEPLGFERERELARHLPSHVRFGTSSWTFPGWAGIVYPGQPDERALRERGLELYARHPLFDTVGIDSSYYRPLEEPALRRYAQQLPRGFRCVSKVWNELTSAVHPRTREANPRFLDAEYFERVVLEPLDRHFSEHIGPIVFELMPLSRAELPEPARFAERLAKFLDGLPAEFPYAVELRNRELLCEPYLQVLRERRVAHVLNYWERMPDVGTQLTIPGVLTTEHVVCRLLIPPGKRYEAEKRRFAPFDRIVEPRETMRDDVVELVRRCAELSKALFVIVNNKAEGSSPLTVLALAERLAGLG